MGSTNLGLRGVDLDRLPDRKRRFVLEYSLDYNAKEAAIRAGYSPTSALGRGAALLKEPLVAAAVAKLQRATAEVLIDHKSRIIQELGHIAFYDVVDFVGKDGKLNFSDFRKLPEGIRRCIVGIKLKQKTLRNGQRVQEVELKLASKLQAIELLMKHLGMMAPEQITHKLVADANFDWDKLLSPPETEVDIVEDHILEVRGRNLESSNDDEVES